MTNTQALQLPIEVLHKQIVDTTLETIMKQGNKIYDDYFKEDLSNIYTKVIYLKREKY